jgi:EAL domain-containing protein (putative c-di-GMP-specific phosphodiesterase class I)
LRTEEQSRASAVEVSRLQPSLRTVISRRQVRSLYQPLVDLSSGATVGYEALARGPRDSGLERPDELFEAARRAGLQSELEWECQRAALEGALGGGLAAGQALFMNLEPGVRIGTRPEKLRRLMQSALARLPVFVELTERALIDRPAEILATVQHLRRSGARIALDDVGADPRSLALMPFLAPDVIKLDLRLVQDNPSRQIAEIVHAVSAEAERTGALVLAEGIETEHHRQTALALGAQYGQGWLLGRPGDLEPHGESAVDSIPEARLGGRGHVGSPFEVVTRYRPTRRGTKRLLLALSRQIEAQAANLGESAVILSTFQEARYFTARTAGRYGAISRSAALVGALGVDLPEHPVAGVRGVSLDLADPLRGEWDVTVIGPHFAAAFVALDRGDAGPDPDRRFDFAITYERDLAIAAAAAMMSRLAEAAPATFQP